MLGMPRSGGSAVGAVLERMGAFYATPESVPGEKSRSGEAAYERRDVRRLHNDIFHHFETEWHRIDETISMQLASADLDAFQLRARQIVGELSAHRPSFLKESRLAFVLPFWRRFLENPVCIQIVRNPLEIAMSLKKRDGFSIQHSLALWELSSITAIKNSRGLPRIVVQYSDLIADPVVTASRLKERLEFHGILNFKNVTDAEIRSLVNIRQRHEWFDDRPLAEFLNPRQIALYQALQNSPENVETEFLHISAGAAEELAAQKSIWISAQKNVMELAEIQKSSRKSWKTHWKLTRLQESARNNLGDSLSLLNRFQQTHLRTLNSFPWILGNLLYLRLGILSRTKRLEKLRELESHLDHQRHKIQQSSALSLNKSGMEQRISEKRSRPVAIIIPVFNDYENLVECVESVLLHTPNPHEILLVDDCSTDERVWPRLCDYANAHDHLRVIRNKTNLGYTRTVNISCEFARPCDVILLHSDTIVTPFWLEKLTAAAYSRAEVATVTALSNAAHHFSVPVNKTDNEIPDNLSPAAYSEWVERLTRRRRPVVPCGNGICFFITRAALEKVGPFDEVSFPAGYAEETDFCMRAKKLGLLSLVDDATFVFHKRTSPADSRQAAALRNSLLKLQQLHPDHKEIQEQWLKNDPIDELRKRLQKAPWLTPSEVTKGKPPLLYVIHASGGGTRFTSEDLIFGMKDFYDVSLLETSEFHWTLYQASGQKLVATRRYHFAEKWQYYLPMNRERLDVFTDILEEMDFKIVHFRHLVGNGPGALMLAKQKGLTVILSLHDFYTVCPTTTLLDEKLEYCSGHCTPGPGTCELRGRWFDPSAIPLKHSYVYVHRKIMADAMTFACDALITTSDYSQNLIIDHFPQIAPKLHVIEHGRDLVQEDLVVSPSPDKPTRIICLGNMSSPKGIGLLREIMALDQKRQQRFEFHFLGGISKEISDLKALGGILHGRYRRENLAEHLRVIGPSYSIICSIWPETYCHTLTESWALGLPVFASKIGTLEERVRKHGGGWTLDYRDAENWYREMLTIENDPVDFELQRQQIRDMPQKTIAEMTAEYLELYQSINGASVRK